MNKRLLKEPPSYIDSEGNELNNISYIKVGRMEYKVPKFITASLIPCLADGSEVIQCKKNVSVPLNDSVGEKWSLFLSGLATKSEINTLEKFVLNSEQSKVCFV